MARGREDDSGDKLRESARRHLLASLVPRLLTPRRRPPALPSPPESWPATLFPSQQCTQKREERGIVTPPLFDIAT